mmetsp:Transcript_24392/g.62915  ORF Transcript_24392/g.62915 Transcript_24392/m.62915 type:complete len:454 (-) Transcript_24392:141-1502(-)
MGGKGKYFPLFHKNNLHGRVASSPAESGNRVYKHEGIRSADPVNALLKLLQWLRKNLHKQQNNAAAFRRKPNKTFPGLPPALWKRNEESMQLMLNAGLQQRVQEGVRGSSTYHVGKLTSTSSTLDVDLVRFKCCKALEFDDGTACVHYHAVCKFTRTPVATYMPVCHRESTWRQQLELKPLVDGAVVDDEPTCVDRLPDFEAIVSAGQPGGRNLVLVKGVTKQAGRPGNDRRKSAWWMRSKRRKTNTQGSTAGRPRLDDDVTVVNADLDAADARVPEHKYADVAGFEADARLPVVVGGFNQRCSQTGEVCIDDAHEKHRLCCACYEPGVAAQPLITYAHLCEGCRCIIHTSIVCGSVMSYPEGKYWCKHCLHVYSDYFTCGPGRTHRRGSAGAAASGDGGADGAEQGGTDATPGEGAPPKRRRGRPPGSTAPHTCPKCNTKHYKKAGCPPGPG